MFFAKAADFRRWLKKNHDRVDELWVGFYKRASGRPTISYKEAVDEALCFGWIDGIRKSLDEESYVNRFTPRRRGSNWSLVNMNRVKELIGEGRMEPAGLRAYETRDPKKSGVYSFERQHAVFDEALENRFRAHRKAWNFFQAQPPGYRKLATFYVMSAKRTETRLRRLDTLITDSAAGRRLAML